METYIFCLHCKKKIEIIGASVNEEVLKKGWSWINLKNNRAEVFGFLCPKCGEKFLK